MLRRILLIVSAILLVLIIAVAGFATYLTRAPFPKTDGQLTVPGLQAPVTVYRDEWGVPQIYAENEHDLFFAQGYVTAQDRLWQMDFQRRVGTGRLSEVLGEATLETDRFLRTLGPHRAAQKDLELLSPETLAMLKDYAAGVNAYIEASRGHLPLEFRILGYQPEPWQPLHSVVWGKMMAWNLGGNWEVELMRARLIDLLGEAKTVELLPRYPDSGPFIIPPEVKRYSGLRGLDPGKALALKRFLKADGESIGSNNWVVAGSRTTTGMPLLANDPHLGMQMPSIWYEVGLHGGGLDVVGVSLPGVPGVVIGHNARIAWGMTNVGPDVQDLFIEKINPDNPDQYEFQDQWRNMEVVEERIQVKGQPEPLVEKVRITHHGPIMNAVVGDLGEEAQPVALRWTALDGNRLLDAVRGINKAQNFQQFRDALRDFAAPAQNFVYADVEGNIGYQMPGQIPIRAKGDGTVPVPGWTGEYEWTGFIPFNELPWVYNPDVGYIATANNQVVPDDYPYLITTDWSAPYRAQRIVELIEGQEKLSPDDFAAIQGDVHPIPADIFVPLLDGITLDDASPAAQQALELVRGWDRNMKADSPAALIFQQFYLELARATVADELQAADDEDLVDDYLKDYGNEHRLLLAELITQPDSPWWDDAGTTDATEDEAEIVKRAFLAAVEQLQARLEEEDPGKWRWGDVHWTNFDHPLGAVKPLDRIFNRRIAARGSSYTVNAGGVSYPGLVMNHGVSMRQIVDLGDLTNSRIVNTTGQSGLPFHRHYGDMIELWQSVGYHPMRFQRPEIEAAAKDVLVLRP